MTLPTPGRHDRVAATFEDLASALDAGLSVDDAFRGAARTPPSAGARGDPIAALTAQGVSLDPVENRILEAALRAGDLPRALRERAESRRFFASLQREVLGAVAYPLFLTCMALAVAGLVSIGSGPALPILALTCLLAGVAGVALLLSRAHRANVLPRLLKPIRSLLLDSGELPYMSSLAGLYRAGVPVLDAHTSAAANSPIGAVRSRMRAVTTVLERDRTPLTEALQRCDALDPESLRILRPAETAGDLEDGLARAIARRREVFARRAKRTAKTIGAVAYAVAVLIAAYVILDFYGALYSGIR